MILNENQYNAVMTRIVESSPIDGIFRLPLSIEFTDLLPYKFNKGILRYNESTKKYFLEFRSKEGNSYKVYSYDKASMDIGGNNYISKPAKIHLRESWPETRTWRDGR